MTVIGQSMDQAAADAALALRLLAIDWIGLGGAVLRGGSGGAADDFVNRLKELVPADTPALRIPMHIPDDRLLGGLDVVATRARGKAVLEPGLLTRVEGGMLLLPSADRIAAATAARIAAALDDGEVRLERDGVTALMPARFSLIAVDTSGDEGTGCPERLKDRLAFWLVADGAREPENISPDLLAELAYARQILASVEAPDDMIDVLVTVAASLGIASPRAPLLALKAARAHAAMCGRFTVTDADVATAARLVLAPRATQFPNQDDAPSEPAPQDQPPPPEPPSESDAETPDPDTISTLDDTVELVLAAAKAALPENLLTNLAERASRQTRTAASGAGDKRRSPSHGRRIGHAAGRPHSGARLDLLATIRAAAPWQTVRQKERASGRGPLIDIRPSDFRIARYETRTEAVTIFVVDASGSSALNRLAEAKGAVELLLADCYVRRDQVAMVVFRRRRAEVLLPPTRSLTKARRVMAELAGGGATPLASGLAAARDLVVGARSRGQTCVCLLLTDGQANVGADGAASGRPAAEADALRAAKALKLAGASTILIDTATRPRPFGTELAAALAARYVALPHADSQSLSKVARSAHRDLQR